MNVPAIVWLVLLVFFVLVEASTVTIVSLWFAAGALVALVAALLGAQVWLQVVLFILVSAALLCALRPLTKKVLKPKFTRTNVDAQLGKEGVVIEAIDNIAASGRVKLGGMEWAARSSEGCQIPEGTLVKVDRIEGVKVYVTAVTVEQRV